MYKKNKYKLHKVHNPAYNLIVLLMCVYHYLQVQLKLSDQKDML